MALSLEEMGLQWGEISKEQGRQQYLSALRTARSTAQKISQLQVDPNWEVWGRHVEEIQKSYLDRSEAAKLKLLNRFLIGKEYLEVKFEQAQADAAYTAVTRVLDIAKILIEQGEEAAKALTKIDGGVTK